VRGGGRRRGAPSTAPLGDRRPEAGGHLLQFPGEEDGSRSNGKANGTTDTPRYRSTSISAWVKLQSP